jgi:hypothetical protein
LLIGQVLPTDDVQPGAQKSFLVPEHQAGAKAAQMTLPV